jgi:hypothetical protein
MRIESRHSFQQIAPMSIRCAGPSWGRFSKAAHTKLGFQLKRLREQRARLITERDNAISKQEAVQKKLDRTLAAESSQAPLHTPASSISRKRDDHRPLPMPSSSIKRPSYAFDDDSFSSHLVEDEESQQLEVEDPADHDESLALPGQYAMRKPSRMFEPPKPKQPALPLAHLSDKKALSLGEKRRRKVG